MTLVAALWGTREAISLLADLTALLEATAHETDQTLRETLLDFRKVASRTADKLSSSLNHVVLGLNDLKIDLDQPEQNAGNQLRGFFKFPQKMRFNRLMEEVRGIQDDLRRFADDVESLLLCAGRNRDIVETATTAYKVRTRLNKMALDNASVAEQLKVMSKVVEDIGKQLRTQP